MSQPLTDALPEIAARLRTAPHLVVCTDFDGTLVPLAADRSTVTLPAAARSALAGLAAAPGVTVVVVSGRSLDDLAARVGVPGVVLAGNHGLELRGPDWAHVEPAVEETRPAVANLAANLARPLEGIAGADVEDKGLSVAVHYRGADPADHEAVRSAVHGVLAASSHPFVLATGPLVFDIRPRVYWDKAAAVNRGRAQVGHPDATVVYIAADGTAEEAFAAFPDGVTVRVGPGPESSAKWTADGPDEVVEFLRWIASLRIGGEPAA
jgi:trehalose 6-phosphate phosphatase